MGDVLDAELLDYLSLFFRELVTWVGIYHRVDIVPCQSWEETECLEAYFTLVKV